MGCLDRIRSKRTSISFKTADFILRLTVMGFTLGGCVSHTEVFKTYATPGKNLKAIVVESNGGATAPFTYEVYVDNDQTRELVARFIAANRSESAWGVNATWDTPTHLRISYLKAKSALLSKPFLTISGQPVTVELVPGVNDKDAPPGGMEFNNRAKQSKEEQ